MGPHLCKGCACQVGTVKPLKIIVYTVVLQIRKFGHPLYSLVAEPWPQVTKETLVLTPLREATLRTWGESAVMPRESSLTWLQSTH